MARPRVIREVCLDNRSYLQAKENVATATRETLALLNTKYYLKVKLKALPLPTKKLSKNASVCQYT